MPNIVHIGLGNFHRAHQAWYTSRASNWSITGVVMSNRERYNEMVRNANQYLLVTLSQNDITTETISVFKSVLLASEEASLVTNTIAEANTQIVTLTITEKGYCLTDKHRLNTNDTAIQQDLDSDTPSSAIGILSDGLVKRFQTNCNPLTVISCDNLANNSTKLRNLVTEYLSLKHPELDGINGWIANNVSFADSMVDRITPRLSESSEFNIDKTKNPHKLPVVVTESYTEWVISDDFAAARPEWERAGAIITNDIVSFEERKLRLLNAAHSYLAYAGLLSGYQYVHEAINDAQLKADVHKLWDEAATSISSPASLTLERYKTELLSRFSVAALQHELTQIAADGSLKLPERLFPIIHDRQEKNLTSPMCANAFAAWIAFVHYTFRTNAELNDPAADQLHNLITGAESVQASCEAIALTLDFPAQQISDLTDQAIGFLRNNNVDAP